MVYIPIQEWDEMKQVLETYHQDMLERRKCSFLNTVQLWDDLHSTLISLTNKFIPSITLAPEIISRESTKTQTDC